MLNNFKIFFLFMLCIQCYVTVKSDQCTKEDNCNEPLHQNYYSQFQQKNKEFLVYTVATASTDGYKRYQQSTQHYNIKPHVLGFGEEWKGGADIRRRPGGGWKINLLKQALADELQQFDDENTLILFTDAYDVIFTSPEAAILKKFKALNARVVFGAEAACWPDSELARKYPEIAEGKRFLNSGMFIGYLKEIQEILSSGDVDDQDDDQLFYTRAFLNKELREKVRWVLDHKSVLFQNLNAAENEIELVEIPEKETHKEYKVKNALYHTEPIIIHGNGPSKLTLNHLGNYLANNWNSVDGCVMCKNGQLDLSTARKSQLPKVLLALFVETHTPFLEEQLNKIYNLEYPKQKIDLFVHNSIKYHNDLIETFNKKYGNEYNSVKEIKPDDGTTEWVARDLSLDHCLSRDCDFYFSVDSVAHIDNPYTLKLLIEQNRTIVAPLLVRPGKAWSNFWGALTKDGFYARSDDYLDIVHNEKRGLWNVPFITNAYLMNASLLRQYDRTKINFVKDNHDADMAFCANLRDLDIFLYISNRVDYGHLVNAENFDVTRNEPEMYQIFDNEIDWEARFIHTEYPENFNPDKKILQPCPDVYWFPIVTERFCDALINLMESYGRWSDGSTQDNRLEGGYEAVPTRDIHMNQVGWEPHWLEFLRKYVRPLQEHVFTGYFHDPPRSLMNFVVRYKPDEQPFLRPHHDSSTYTINIALNKRGTDYEGGGCRFIRYNCSVVDTKKGWLLMHPGRLTHYHEGLQVTKGVRYIMVSFVDP